MSAGARAFADGREWALAVLPAAPDADGETAVLVTEQVPSMSDLRRRSRSLAAGGTIAVLISPAARRPAERASPVRRAAALGLAGSRAVGVRLQAARVARRLRALGLVTGRIDIGPSKDGYALSLGRARVRVAAASVVCGVRGRAHPNGTLLDQAVRLAGLEAAEGLVVERGRVLGSGTLMVELAVTGRRDRRVLRIGDPARDVALDSQANPLDALLACDPPPEVRRRLTAPLARGRVDGLAWALEEKRPGTHPWRLSRRVADECYGFLEALASVSRPAAAPPPASLGEGAVALEPLVDRDERRRLALISERADEALAPVPRRWGHGDFHPGNLLVAGDALETVLDWDAASPDILAGLDQIHLLAMARPALRRLSHGARCAGPLRELVVAGSDAPLEGALRAAAVPSVPAVREALIDAYWLSRVIRDVRTFPDRAHRPAWIQANLRRPLAVRGGQSLR